MSHKEIVYLSLGSNLGDSKKLLQSACQSIRILPQVTEVRFSAIYRSAPISPLPQPDYLNLACSLITTLDLFTLFTYLEQIEKNLGKIPKPKDAPRKIDIDILYFGNHTLNSEQLVIPHPKMKERLFVLQPLLDLTTNLPDIPCLLKYIKPLISSQKVLFYE